MTTIVWGLFGTIVGALHQAKASGLSVPPDQVLHLPMMLLAIAVSIWEARRRSADRETLIDQYAGVVFGVVFIVLLLLNVTAQHTVVPTKAILFWSVGFTMALLIVGIQSSRVLLAGGTALLMASIAAPLIPDWFHGILALGWAVGFVGPGVVLALGRHHGRTVSV